MASVTRPYRGVSADDRRAERRGRLLDAGFDALAEVGLAGLTMKEVRVRAGLSERYFYESFRDLDELVAALLDVLAAEVGDALVEAIGQAPAELAARTRAIVLGVLAVVTADPRKGRAYVEAAQGGARVQRMHYYRPQVELMAQQMREVGGLDDDRYAAALEATAYLLVFGFASTLGVWLDGELELTADELADHVARLAVAAVDAVRA
jgi:AcrR family transcriptional regulator